MRSSIDKSQEFYTTIEAAKKLGLSNKVIMRMCDQGKFKGASRVDGHWRIPKVNFITSKEQDGTGEITLKNINNKNKEAGEVDEFDL